MGTKRTDNGDASRLHFSPLDTLSLRSTQAYYHDGAATRLDVGNSTVNTYVVTIAR